MSDTTVKVVRIVSDLICLILVSLPCAILKYADINPFQRGFFCDDETIMKPYREDTVSWDLTIALSVLLPTVFIIVTEALRHATATNRRSLPEFTIGALHIPHWFWKTYRYVGAFYFGLAACMAFKDIGKFIIGRPRPHFLAVCKPNFSEINCTADMRYIQGDVCYGDAAQVKEGRLSFPSGHSSLSFFSAAYLVIYLQARMIWYSTKLIKHTLQVVLLLLAFSCALSRISDYHHHWSDVLSGSLLGIIGALLTIFCVGDLWSPSEVNESDDSEQKTSSVRLKARDTGTASLDRYQVMNEATEDREEVTDHKAEEA